MRRTQSRTVATVPDPASAPTHAPTAKPRRPMWLATLAALVTLVSVLGLWARQNSQSTTAEDAASPAGLFLASQAAGTSLGAVGKVVGLSLPCTAWLLDVGGQPGDQAYALTAGRCVGITDSVTVITDQETPGVQIAFQDFAPVTSAKPSTPVTAPVQEVTWASMRWTDLAVLKLATTYGDLSAAGVEPIRAVAPPAAGTAILVAGVPVDGVPADQRYLRGSRCTIGSQTHVVESEWLFDAMRSSDCAGFLAGSAGSAAFNPGGEAVGMLTTTSIGASEAEDCNVGQPCEVRGDAVMMAADRTYLTPVESLQGCFPMGTFKLGGDCPLEDPEGVAAALPATRTAPPGANVEVRLDSSRPTPSRVSDKQGTLGATTCSDPVNWSQPTSSRNWTLDVTLPDDEGWVLACVGSAEQPTPVVIQIDGLAHAGEPDDG